MTDPTQPAPISVKATATPVVMSESTKLILIALFAGAADHFLHSEAAIGVVVACGGVFATAVWGLWSRLKTWGALRLLAGLVDDSVATVGRK